MKNKQIKSSIGNIISQNIVRLMKENMENRDKCFSAKKRVTNLTGKRIISIKQNVLDPYALDVSFPAVFIPDPSLSNS